MNYAEFLNHLGKMVTFDGNDPGDASIGTLQAIISLAEARIYREVQTSTNEKLFSGTITTNTFPLPDDFRQPSVVYLGGKPLEPVTTEYLYEYLAADHTGDTLYFAQVVRSYQFAPAATDGTSLLGTYYCAYPTLAEDSIASNLLFQESNDLWFFACMVEAAPLYGFQDQLQIWEAKYQMVRDSLNLQNSRTAMGAGRLKRRASTTLMG